jgi:hypothetical protein
MLDMSTLVRVVASGAATLITATLFSSVAVAQITKVSVRGGDKALREQVITLLGASPGALPPRASGSSDVRIDLQKGGGAKVKFGGAEVFLPGPSAADIVAQFRAGLPGALEAQHAGQVARRGLGACPGGSRRCLDGAVGSAGRESTHIPRKS